MTIARKARLIAVTLASVSAACTAAQPFVWVESLPSPPPAEESEYRVSAGDVLAVRVWNHQDMSIEHALVRDDGNVSLPFLQDVPAAGMTPVELSSRVSGKLKTWVTNPVVTVTLEARRPLQISVLGEVTRPGTYEVQQGAGVLRALAAAGGLTQWADRDAIYVLRDGHREDGGPKPTRIRFRYDRLAGNAPPAATFRLRPSDVVVVE
jgi:polysaccharide export outer membrane protein